MTVSRSASRFSQVGAVSCVHRTPTTLPTMRPTAKTGLKASPTKEVIGVDQSISRLTPSSRMAAMMFRWPSRLSMCAYENFVENSQGADDGVRSGDGGLNLVGLVQFAR